MLRIIGASCRPSAAYSAGDGLGVHRLGVVQGREDRVLDGHDRRTFSLQPVRIEQVATRMAVVRLALSA